MSSESAAILVMVAIATIPIAMMAWLAVERIWDHATYAAYVWRHRNKLKF